MVWPTSGLIGRAIVDLRADPNDAAELVDQAHFGERLRILGELGEWRYVQGDDHYFGWLREAEAPPTAWPRGWRIVGTLLADVHEQADPSSRTIARLPVGTSLPFSTDDFGGWLPVPFTTAVGNNSVIGFIPEAAAVDVVDLPHRYPTAADYLKTAESFIGVPYLWGGTTALGLDCSAFVQQVYRLNGVALPRDADQQAMLGRRVEEARAGDLMFFGIESVTHVALATSATEFIHAPMKGGVVERSRLGGDRKLRVIRRYLPDVGS
jgi:cell wall-associated NlpC family hydrolase